MLDTPMTGTNTVPNLPTANLHHAQHQSKSTQRLQVEWKASNPKKQNKWRFPSTPPLCTDPSFAPTEQLEKVAHIGVGFSEGLLHKTMDASPMERRKASSAACRKAQVGGFRKRCFFLKSSRGRSKNHGAYHLAGAPGWMGPQNILFNIQWWWTYTWPKINPNTFQE